jgi:carbon-monoxide dehydrogenase large subunit
VFPFGTHVCVVEVDTETGGVELRNYVAVDDCGNQVNPLIVEGQVHGGIVQSIAQALFEETVYDEGGQILTGSLVDYMIPSAADLPRIDSGRTVTPSPTNPLGAKGIGEAGTIAATACVVNAVVDALSGIGVRHLDMPLQPARVWEAIQQAKASS